MHSLISTQKAAAFDALFARGVGHIRARSDFTTTHHIEKGTSHA